MRNILLFLNSIKLKAYKTLKILTDSYSGNKKHYVVYLGVVWHAGRR